MAKSVEERQKQRRECQRSYEKTEAGKAAKKRYRQSEKGKIGKKQSPSGKRNWMKWILNDLGPNDYS